MFITRGSLNKNLLKAYEAGRVSRNQDMQVVYENGVERGRGLGRIEGAAEAINRGYIMSGYDVIKEAERILGESS